MSCGADAADLEVVAAGRPALEGEVRDRLHEVGRAVEPCARSVSLAEGGDGDRHVLQRLRPLLGGDDDVLDARRVVLGRRGKRGLRLLLLG